MTDLPDEDTIRTRRTRSGAGDPAAAEPPTAGRADSHVPAAGGSGLPDSAANETVSAETVPSQTESDDGGPVRRRSTYVPGSVDDDSTDGSTIVARRESRRRAARDAHRWRSGDTLHAADADPGQPALRTPSPPAVPPARSRVASAPDAASSEVYGARPPQPVVASRAPAQQRAPQAPVDGDATAAGRRRRTRTTAVIVVLAASAVALAAAASLITLTLTL